MYIFYSHNYFQKLKKVFSKSFKMIDLFLKKNINDRL